MSTFVILWIITAHWVADFVLQSHWMAANKSKDFAALSAHVTVYTVAMSVMVGGVLFAPAGPAVWAFIFITGAAHFVTDAITSRITSRLFLSQFQTIDGIEHWDGPRLAMKKDFNPHYFFVVIGLDQVLHYAQLFLTVTWIMQRWPS